MHAAELAATHMQAKMQHAERAARVHEATAEKLRARLAAQVTAEERRRTRNAEAYTRAKRAVAANGGSLLGRDTCSSVFEQVSSAHRLQSGAVQLSLHELQPAFLKLRFMGCSQAI